MQAICKEVWTMSEEKAVEGLEERKSAAIKSNDGADVWARNLRESNVWKERERDVM